MADETQAPPAADSRKRESITLSEPVVRGETTIGALHIRKPQGGELRGLSLADVISTDFIALFTLIPRISEPPLTQAEAEALDPADLAQIGGTIRGFFMTAAEKEAIESYIADRLPSTS